MKRIKDPVHGYIEVESYLAENIVDSQSFQRLRDIRQLDTTRMVYPSATHSRFEHTLGVYHLGKLAFENLVEETHLPDELDDKVIQRLRKTLQAACLLHDIGHFPFSHLGEAYIDKDDILTELDNYDLPNRFEQTGSSLEAADPHELMSCYITLSKYGSKLTSWGVTPSEVCAYILGTSIDAYEEERWQSQVVPQLLHSQIDVDRLDYMLRDDLMSGASLVSVDAERLVNTYTVIDRSLGLSNKGLSTIENFLRGRMQLYIWVTQHHKVIYTNELMRGIISEIVDEVEEDPFTIDKIADETIDDHYVLNKARELWQQEVSDVLTKYYDRYRSRNYHASCWKHIVDFREKIPSKGRRDDIFDDIDETGEGVRDYLSDELCIDKHAILTGTSNISGFTYEELEDIYIDVDHGDDSATPLTDFGIYQPRENFARPVPYVFVPEQHRSKAVAALRDFSIV